MSYQQSFPTEGQYDGGAAENNGAPVQQQQQQGATGMPPNDSSMPFAQQGMEGVEHGDGNEPKTTLWSVVPSSRHLRHTANLHSFP